MNVFKVILKFGAPNFIHHTVRGILTSVKCSPDMSETNTEEHIAVCAASGSTTDQQEEDEEEVDEVEEEDDDDGEYETEEDDEEEETDEVLFRKRVTLNYVVDKKPKVSL